MLLAVGIATVSLTSLGSVVRPAAASAATGAAQVCRKRLNKGNKGTAPPPYQFVG